MRPIRVSSPLVRDIHGADDLAMAAARLTEAEGASNGPGAIRCLARRRHRTSGSRRGECDAAKAGSQRARDALAAAYERMTGGTCRSSGGAPAVTQARLPSSEQDGGLAARGCCAASARRVNQEAMPSLQNSAFMRSLLVVSGDLYGNPVASQIECPQGVGGVPDHREHQLASTVGERPQQLGVTTKRVRKVWGLSGIRVVADDAVLH